MVDDPVERFRALLERATGLDIKNPNAMVVSTVDPSGAPSSRQVLLKSFDDRGFVFYTNLESRKGRQLAENPKVSLNFYWRELGEQVSIEGTAQRVDDEEADEYFATRPRGSQLGAWASQQSRPLDSRAKLLADVAKLEAKYLLGSVPRPPHWSGFRVVPNRFEFWVEGRFRLHDRTVYEAEGDCWRSYKVYP